MTHGFLRDDKGNKSSGRLFGLAIIVFLAIVLCYLLHRAEIEQTKDIIILLIKTLGYIAMLLIFKGGAEKFVDFINKKK